ncbi:MAG TPA: hypothetical protein VH305_11235 [Gaiella sp.]
MTTIDSGAAPPRAKRPVSVSVVLAIAIVAAAISFWHAATLLDDVGGDRSQLAHGLAYVGFGVAALAVGIGALRMRSWAWELFMIWAVAGLTYQILRHFFFDDAFYLGLALYVVAVFALTPRDVQVAFGIKEPPAAQLDRPTRNPLDRD